MSIGTWWLLVWRVPRSGLSVPAFIVWPRARGHIGATTGLGPGQVTW